MYVCVCICRQVKNTPAIQEGQDMQDRSQSLEDPVYHIPTCPLEEGMATHSSTLAW